MNKNDETITKIQEEVKRKRIELGPRPRFVPNTNCSLSFGDGSPAINLHTLCLESDLNLVQVKLNMYRMSADELGIPVTFGGYTVTEWMDDVQQKMKIVDYHRESTKLTEIEKRLEDLMSDDKRTSLELDTIISSL